MRRRVCTDVAVILTRSVFWRWRYFYEECVLPLKLLRWRYCSVDVIETTIVCCRWYYCVDDALTLLLLWRRLFYWRCWYWDVECILTLMLLWRCVFTDVDVAVTLCIHWRCCCCDDECAVTLMLPRWVSTDVDTIVTTIVYWVANIVSLNVYWRWFCYDEWAIVYWCWCYCDGECVLALLLLCWQMWTAVYVWF